jgi:hypothetical protein
VPVYRSFWTNKSTTLKFEYHRLIGQFPDADTQLKQLFKIQGDIEAAAGYTRASVDDSEKWSAIVNSAEENRQHFRKAPSGKTLSSAHYGTYTGALQELKAVLKASNPVGRSKNPKSAAT